MIEFAVVLAGIGVLCGLAEWRWGLLLALATALLQDPLRKIAPGQPVLFVLFVGVVFGGACLGAWLRGIPLTPTSVFGNRRQLMTIIWLLLLLIILQAYNSYLRFDNL